VYFCFTGYQVPIDTQVPQEQTIIGALDSEGLEGNSADAMLGARPAPAEPARDAGTPPSLLREQSVASRGWMRPIVRAATSDGRSPQPRSLAGASRSPDAGGQFGGQQRVAPAAS
jgi:hypothetical protein